MALNWYKYDIDIRNDYAIKLKRILFDFVQRTFNSLDVLYLNEKCLLIDKIIKYQLRKHSEAEIEKVNREKVRKQKKGRYIQAFSKKSGFVNKTNRTSQATSNNSNSNFNANIPQFSEASSSG